MAVALVRRRKGRLTEWISPVTGMGGRFKALLWDVRLLLILIGGLVAVLGVIAIATPTTNWDSFTYHLPRVMHWIQQGSVEHFATGNTKQIEFAPWPAFILANLYQLEGSDRFFNLVQWLAMVGSVMAASLLAQQFWCLQGTHATVPEQRDSNRQHAQRTEALAALLVATLPIGVVESITTQTDYVVAFWLVCLANFALAAWKEPRQSWPAVGLGATLGLGLLSKATMFFYAGPLVAATCVGWVWRLPGWRLKAQPLAIIGIMVLALNLPHWQRNFAVFGSPMGSQAMFAMVQNKYLSASSTLSNIIRNLTLETNTGLTPLTKKLNQILYYAHQLTGKNLNDPDTTYVIGAFVFFREFSVDDSYASNPYHCLLILLAVALALKRGRRCWPELAYVILVGLSFVAFCGYLRWQQWHTRMHLAYLVLLMPWVAVKLVEAVSDRGVTLLAVGLLSFAVFSGLQNENCLLADTRFLHLPRENQYLAPYDLKKKYTFASTVKLQQLSNDIIASGCERVGLKLQFEDAEYLIWRLLLNRGFRGSVEHVWVENESAQLQNPLTWPEAIITSFAGNPPPAIAQRFPYKTDYGHFKIYWSRQVRSAQP